MTVIYLDSERKTFRQIAKVFEGVVDDLKISVVTWLYVLSVTEFLSENTRSFPFPSWSCLTTAAMEVSNALPAFGIWCTGRKSSFLAPEIQARSGDESQLGKWGP